jgi:dihydropteroate synthase
MTEVVKPVIRVEHAGLGHEAQVRLVVSGDVDLDHLRSVWVSSGAAVHAEGSRLHATTTVQALVRAAGRAFGAQTGRHFETVLRDAITAWDGAPPPVPTAGGVLATDARPLVMGVVNVTPDSFAEDVPLYPGDHPRAAIDHGRRLAAEGADILDVGGESTRPGATPVAVDEELRRVVPVVEALAAEGFAVSIDTSKPEVAVAALAAGANVVNDVSGAGDPALLAATAEGGAGYVLMHSRGTPQTMATLAEYDDVVADVYEFLAEGLERCADAGIARDRVIVDPGLGFAKTAAHNLELLHSLRQLRSLGRPVLVGASRKSFLGALLDGAGEQDRLEGSLACAAAAVSSGAAILRVHDVAATVRVARVARAISAVSLDWPSGRR